MGLDMNLKKRTYVKRWNHQKPEKQHEVTVKKGGETLEHIKPERISHIIEDVMYWRKANQVHNWFVQNVQNGVDDCGEYRVSTEKLQELVDICKKVLDNSKLVDGEITNGYTITSKGREPIMEKGQYIEDPSTAKELLPTQSGFFFGSEDYDQFYYNDVKETYEQLSQLLKDETGLNVDYYYQSSW